MNFKRKWNLFPNMLSKRIDIINKIIQDKNVTQFVDMGVNEELYNKLNIGNIVSLEIDNSFVQETNNYIIEFCDYTTNVFNHLSDNTLYALMIIDGVMDNDDITNIIECINTLKIQNLTNSYIVVWGRTNQPQNLSFRVFEIGSGVNITDQFV